MPNDLCQCGCGSVIPLLDKKGRSVRFVNGHSRRGCFQTDEAKRKVSKARKGKPLSAEHRAKLSMAHKGKILSLEAIRKTTEANRGQKRTLEQKQRMSEVGKLRYTDPEERMKTSASLIGHSVPDSFRLRMKEAIHNLWQDPDYATRQRKAIGAGDRKRPNWAEQRLLEIISQLNLPFKYVGNGEVWLGNRNPDFINTNGKKQVIELMGEHWHNIFDGANRQEHYKQYGYSMLVLWCKELKDMPKVAKKLRRFANASSD